MIKDKELMAEPLTPETASELHAIIATMLRDAVFAVFTAVALNGRFTPENMTVLVDRKTHRTPYLKIDEDSVVLVVFVGNESEHYAFVSNKTDDTSDLSTASVVIKDNTIKISHKTPEGDLAITQFVIQNWKPSK